MKYPLIWFVQGWRKFISPIYGDVCKYYPSCSAYGLEALKLHGAVKGSWLIIRRIARCHPWAHGGFDPVPGSDLEAEIAVDPARFGLKHPHEFLTDTRPTGVNPTYKVTD